MNCASYFALVLVTDKGMAAKAVDSTESQVDELDGQLVIENDKITRTRAPSLGVIKQMKPAMLESSFSAHKQFSYHASPRDVRDGGSRKRRDRKLRLPDFFGRIVPSCLGSTVRLLYYLTLFKAHRYNC